MKIDTQQIENPPTCSDLFNELLKEVSSESASWRHGSRMTVVYRRESDGTFWRAKYRLSTDGECNELREGIAKIDQVEPYEVAVTKYRPIAEKGAQ